MNRLLLRIFVAALMMATIIMPAFAQSTAAQKGQSTPASVPKPTPEQTEVLKKQNEKALAENALITQANAALNAKEWQKAEDALKQLIVLAPLRWEYFQSLGTAQLNLGKSSDSVIAFETGIRLAQDERKAADAKNDPAKLKLPLAQMMTLEGNANIKLRNYEKAVALFSQAAELDPNPATAYFNLCATEYNMGKMNEAVAACEKSLAADPSKADAWFIKGSALYGNGSIDAKGKYIVPKGTVEALRKYMELAPNGGHVEDVKAMLEALK